MIRRITVSAGARCPISVATAYAQSFLRVAEAGGEESTLVAGPLRRRVQITFGVATDLTQPGRGDEELRIRWSARTRWLPEFRGTLRVRIVSVDAIMLLIDGAYEPPGGLLGRAFDAIAGQRIARATARDFVTRIARDLERREAAWQQGFEPAASERGTT